MLDDDLGFWVDTFDAGGNVSERLGNISTFDAARLVFEHYARTLPDRHVVWSQRSRIIRESLPH